MWVTAYTDASRGQDGLCSWAIWCRSEKGRVIQSEVCPNPPCDDIAAAECYAVLMAIERSIAEWPETTGFYVRTDSMQVVRALSEEKQDGTTGFKYVAWFLRHVIAERGLGIQVKHVKAHTGASHVRAYLNRQVDHRAKATRTRGK